MTSSTANAYGVEILGYAPDGQDSKGNVAHQIRWRDGMGLERSARTRGSTTAMLHGIGTGSRVNLIRDGRGSIVKIEATR